MHISPIFMEFLVDFFPSFFLYFDYVFYFIFQSFTLPFLTSVLLPLFSYWFASYL